MFSLYCTGNNEKRKKKKGKKLKNTLGTFDLFRPVFFYFIPFQGPIPPTQYFLFSLSVLFVCMYCRRAFRLNIKRITYVCRYILHSGFVFFFLVPV